MSGIKRFINPVSILIVTALLVLFLNRGLLFSEQSGSKEVKQLLDRVDGVVERMNANAGSAQFDPQTQYNVEAEGDMPTAEAVVQTEKAEPDKARSVDNPAPALDSPSEKVASQEPEGLLGPVREKAGKGQATAQNSEPDNNVADEVAAAAREKASAIWLQARDAAWRGEPKKAVGSYRKLIAIQPENYGAYGELGNVLWQMGDTEGAVEAYTQCVLLLNHFGHQQSAWYMLGVVSQLDREKAQELYQKLYSRRNSSLNR